MTSENAPRSSFTLVDMHCHVDLYPSPPALVREVEAAQIHTIAVTNAPSVARHTLRLAADCHFVHAAVGLHPELVATHGHEVDRLWPLLDETRFVGEIGLDYTTPDQGLRRRQREIFAQILERCAPYGNKVVTVHSRRAATDVIAAVGDHFPGKVILHWFTGTQRELDRAIAQGLFFSVNPAMVASKSGRSLLAAMPRERVLTETDGPFVRTASGVARPGNTKQVIEALAGFWKISPHEAGTLVEHTFAALIE